MKELLNLYELAAQCGVAAPLVREALEQGVIRRAGLMHPRRIPVFDPRERERLQEWLAEREREAGGDCLR